MAGCRSRQSYADTTSRRLSARDTRERCASVAAWPRRSKVRHTQPSPAMLRARTRSKAWLPPQPCTNSTPGIFASGARNVPDSRWPSTGIETDSLCVAMSHHSCRFGDAADRRVLVVEHDAGARGMGLAGAVALGSARAHPGQRRVVAQRFQRADSGHAGAAGPPRLFQHAAPAIALRTPAFGHVIVAARGEKACVAVSDGAIV